VLFGTFKLNGTVHSSSQVIHLAIHLLINPSIHPSTWVAGALWAAVSEGKACLSVSGCWRVRELLMQAEVPALPRPVPS